MTRSKYPRTQRTTKRPHEDTVIDHVSRIRKHQLRAKRRRLEQQVPRPLVFPAEIWHKIASYLPLSSQASLGMTCRGLCDKRIPNQLCYECPVEHRKLMVLSRIGRMPTNVWQKVADFLPLSDKASLALSCSCLYARVGIEAAVLAELRLPSRYIDRLKTLYRVPEMFDQRTLCAECVVHHKTDEFMPDGPLAEFSEYDYTTLNIGHTDYDWDDLRKLLETHRHGSGQYSPSPEDPDEAGWNARVEFKYDDGTDHWLANIDYTRDITIPLLQDSSNIELPFLCEHHSTHSPTLSSELKMMLDDYPRPWEDQEAPAYWGTSRRCTYCPTEFLIAMDYVNYGDDMGFNEVKARKRATHELSIFKLSIFRTIDLGSLYTPHAREWKALTTPWTHDTVEKNPLAQEVAAPYGHATKNLRLAGKRKP